MATVDLSNASQEVKDYVARLEAKAASADSRVDSLLGKVAASRWSWLILLAWSAVCFALGATIF